MNRVVLALFPDRSSAERLQQRLSQAGIAAEIHDELRLERCWFVNLKGAGVRLEVPATDFDNAHRLVLEWDARDAALRGAIRCPECKSLRIDYPQFTRNSVMPNLIIGMLAAIGRVEKEYYCYDCHFTWPREGTRPSPTRPHSAPYYFIEGIELTTASGTSAPADANANANAHANPGMNPGEKHLAA